MEPYHQFDFAPSEIPDWRKELRSIGFCITEYEKSFLGPRFPDFADIVIQKDARKALFAVAEDLSRKRSTTFVYPNIPSAQLAALVRDFFVVRGANRDYFDERLWDRG